MHLAYFDENKYSDESPYFFVGGFLILDTRAEQLELALRDFQHRFFHSPYVTKETEFHGKELFHGKGNAKGRELSERLQVFDDIASFVIDHRIPVRMVCIDVLGHRQRYMYPMKEYPLGLILILERFCDYLDEVDDLGIVFGDYEKDEVTRSVMNFSQFKLAGTPMYYGRSLDRLLDTIYFTQSHHSRFLQVADLLVYMAGRYETNTGKVTKWHDKELRKIWRKIKANGDIIIQRWP